ncbi:MAG TPA: PQQ-binding-like beta-propeller repeat protein [Spirillospora sp.]|nr:PQQ-binding-like beta-propeller repeat protein [Spirillospora sp.]
MPEPAVHPEQPSPPPRSGRLARLLDRRARGLPEPVRILPAAQRAVVARAVRRCVLPADPALDEPTLALAERTLEQARRYAWVYRWPPVALVVAAVAALIASRDERMVAAAVLFLGTAIVIPSSAMRRDDRLERIARAIRGGAAGEGGQPVTGARRRLRLPSPATAATIAGILVVASGLWLQWDARRHRPDWTTDGPHGAFPAAIAAQVPLRPRKVIASWPFPVLAYRGLAIEALRNSGSVTAHRIRPAGTYWRLTRRDHRLVDAGLDPATGRLLLLWDHLDHETGDRRGPLQAMVVDARTGKVRWNRTISNHAVGGSAVIGSSALIQADGLNVLDPATGDRRWRRHDDCGTATMGTSAGTLLLERECPRITLLEGYDAATGRRRWSKDFASWWPGRQHARVLPVKVGVLDRNRIVVWTLEREAVYDTATGAQVGEHPQPINGDGKVFDTATGYGPCSIRSHRGPSDGICATDAATGRRLWSFRFPGAEETTQLSSPVAVDGGRVYTLTSDHGGEIVDHVDVNDARTGALLGRVSPAFPRPDHLYGIQSAAGGALVLTDDLVPTPTPHKTVVLGDG